jgi:hypothetical protein
VLPVQLGIGAAPGLPILFERGDVYYRGTYWDSLGVISIASDQLAVEDYPLAIAHELGHAFGLLHVDPAERRSVMNVGNLEVAPTGEDAAAVRAMWPSCR